MTRPAQNPAAEAVVFIPAQRAGMKTTASPATASPATVSPIRTMPARKTAAQYWAEAQEFERTERDRRYATIAAGMLARVAGSAARTVEAWIVSLLTRLGRKA
ncbi:MAG: hypothetical protein OJJ54_09660 [Pseudonocardia sp.]|nr:hypothetical protein [Pseudonocardia sp.]